MIPNDCIIPQKSYHRTAERKSGEQPRKKAPEIRCIITYSSNILRDHTAEKAGEQLLLESPVVRIAVVAYAALQIRNQLHIFL